MAARRRSGSDLNTNPCDHGTGFRPSQTGSEPSHLAEK